MTEKNEVKICVPVCVRHGRELPGAVARAVEVADAVEVRLDYFSEIELTQSPEDLRSLLAAKPCPVILTLRPAEYGGARAISAGDRLFFRIHNSSLVSGDKSADFWDIEHDLAATLQQRQKEGNDVVGWGLCDWTRTICSHHDFVCVPADLGQIYERMAATPARVLKIAVQADDVTDCITVFHLLERARSEGREMIAIAMGPAGIATRILGPSRGAFLTYGALESEHATAPGQLTARELRELYRIDAINQRTQIMGLVGLPVGHSVSPHIHNAAFAATDIDAVYIPFEVRDAAAFLRRMVHPRTREIDWNLRGLSVTAPHKATVMDHLDWVEPAAKEIGAVSTIVVVDDALHGYNTDATAVLQPVIEKLGPLRNARCAVIGAGGAASAVLWSLRREGARVTLFARDVAKANSVAEKFGASCESLESARLDEFDLVINATPLGTHGSLEQETPATAPQLRGARFAYDLVYNPIETRFMREASEAGCETIGGLEMLVGQAAEQFRLWTGVDAPVEIMREAAVRALGDQTQDGNRQSEI